MLNKDEILDLLSKEKDLTAGISANIIHGGVKYVYAENDGVCIITQAGIPMTYAVSDEASHKMFSLLADIECCVCCHRVEVNDLKAKFKNITCNKACWQVLYDKQVSSPEISGLEIKRLPVEDEYIDFVTNTYTLHYGREHIKKTMENAGIYAAYINGEIAGYIGSHEELSIGLLEVMPAYRNSGVGTNLLNFMINKFEKEGLVPYAQIVYGNVKCYNMHVKMGYIINPKLIYWCY